MSTTIQCKPGETQADREAKNIRNRIRRGKLPRFTTMGRMWQGKGAPRVGGAQPRGLLGRRGDIKFVV